MSLLLALTVALILTTTVQAKRGHTRPVETRIAWLKDRLKTHTYICRHGKSSYRNTRYHCRARVWSRRELREAQLEFEWAWQRWLPDKWARVGACETGYGRRPGNWKWDSGKYVSAFGIIRGGYAQFAHQIGLQGWPARDKHGVYMYATPSPWEQYQVALAIHNRYGFSGWGCRGA